MSLMIGLLYFIVGLMWISADELLNFSLTMVGLSYIGLGIYCCMTGVMRNGKNKVVDALLIDSSDESF